MSKFYSKKTVSWLKKIKAVKSFRDLKGVKGYKNAPAGADAFFRIGL